MSIQKHHPNKHRLERAEQATDIITLGFIVVLGLAMLIGLFTASGAVTW